MTLNYKKINTLCDKMGLNDWINENVKCVLLVEPNFPIPAKSRNHTNFLPIGLLKIASYLRKKDINVKLIRQESNNCPLIEENYKPDLICVTSIFTYWSKYVKQTVEYYRKLYPNTPILVGGIYASLMPDHCLSYTKCDEVITGIVEESETLIPAYDLVDVDYQIVHTTRGCIRRCECCGVYEIEPNWSSKKSIKDEIIKNRIIFYDNNLLANPYIENILEELIELKNAKKISYIESQSGFDGRLLVQNPNLAKLIKKAGFKNPKIAWDGPLSDAKSIQNQIKILKSVGYASKDISVFMLYNHELDYNVMEEKRVNCFNWQVQITDCRFRPLDSVDDKYNPQIRIGQSRKDYYIHENWTDKGIRQFRRNIRRHNICVRLGTLYHSYLSERKKIPHEIAKKYIKVSYEEAIEHIPDAWDPSVFHKLEDTSKQPQKLYFKI